MHPPIFVREPSAEGRARLEAALRASDAFTVRRAQIVLASAEGRRPRSIARDLRRAAQTVRNGIRALNAGGLAALTAGSSRPKGAAPVLGAAERERPRGEGARLLRPVAARARAHDAAVRRRAAGECRGLPLSRLDGRPLAAEGVRVLALVWDNAPWHVSREVRAWIAAHNRQVKRDGGCRLLVCRLPSKSPWLNPIEPKGSVALSGSP